MSDTVVVTLRIGDRSQDFELPSREKLEKLYPRLLAVLKSHSPNSFGSSKAIVFRRQDGYLCDPDATLQDYGVLTGAKLELIREE